MQAIEYLSDILSRKFFQKFLSLVIFTLIFFVIIPPIVDAQWSFPVKLSPNATKAQLNENMGPCLAVSGDTLHVIWFDYRSKGTAIYYTRSIDTGLTWSVPVALTDTIGDADFPSIAVSNGSNVHVAWRDNRFGHYASFYKRSTNGGNSWEADFCLDSNTVFWPGIAAYGSMVVVSLNKLANPLDNTNTEVYFMHSLDNGTIWGSEQRISNAPLRSEDPAIAIEGTYIHLVWNDNRTDTMSTFYSHSLDTGTIFTADTELIDGGVETYSTMVCLNGSHVDVVSGNANPTHEFNIVLKQSSDYGMTWGQYKQLTNGNNSDAYPYLVRDSMNMHLVYPQLSTHNAWYLYSSDGGTTWSSPLLIGNGGQPYIAYTGQTLHVIWPDSGLIYYKRNPSGNIHGTTAISESFLTQPSDAMLSVYPNIIDRTTIIKFSIPISGNVSVSIFDIFGREITSIIQGGQMAHGINSIIFDASQLSPGFYFCRLKAGNSSVIAKMMVVR